MLSTFHGRRPLLWAPLSELYGRQPVFFLTFMAMTICNAGAAGADNMTTLLVLRLLGGTFGSSPFTNGAGVVADMLSATQRGPATAIFALFLFLGPSMGPVAGGFLGEHAGWRWNQGLMAAFSGVVWLSISLFVPETYAPLILRRRAEKLSKSNGKDQVYVSKLDLGKTTAPTVAREFSVALSRPWVLLFSEPIVFITAIYLAIIYGTLYMLFAAYPIVFQQQRGWSPGIGGLAFIGVAVGQMFAVAYIVYDNKRYIKISEASGGNAPPEARLPPSIIGSVLLPVALFWFAWTNGSEVHWIVPIIAGGFFSCGLVLVFLSLFAYLVDSCKSTPCLPPAPPF
jgi:multidrug resistance protein